MQLKSTGSALALGLALDRLPSPARSRVLDCRASSWRAVSFSAGGDGVGGLFEQRPFG
jgi:hypothetical protein